MREYPLVGREPAKVVQVTKILCISFETVPLVGRELANAVQENISSFGRYVLVGVHTSAFALEAPSASAPCGAGRENNRDL